MNRLVRETAGSCAGLHTAGIHIHRVSAGLAGERHAIFHQQRIAIAAAEQLGYLTIVGDAALDSTLHMARIERAICIVSALPSDAENLYTVLSAKSLNPDIRAIARASNEEAMQKLRRETRAQRNAYEELPKMNHPLR